MKILVDFYRYLFYCHRNLLLSSLFCLALLLIRFWATMSTSYSFLGWNLFLAFLPFFISSFFLLRPGIWSKVFLRYLTLALWLLFLPNSFYIITDLVHLRAISNAPAWFDIILIYSFAWTGLWLGVLSIQQVEAFAYSALQPKRHIAIRLSIVLLIAIGIYLGRELRFNSWDILTNLGSLANTLISLVFNPVLHAGAWSKIFLHSGLFYLILQAFRTKMPGQIPVPQTNTTTQNN
jgi:uncharacterized membrane protein